MYIYIQQVVFGPCRGGNFEIGKDYRKKMVYRIFLDAEAMIVKVVRRINDK